MNGRRSSDPLTDLVLGVVIGSAVLAGVLWVAGALSALISGVPLPRGEPLAGLVAFAHLANPSLAWHAKVGGPVLYWTVTAVVLAVLGAFVWLGWRLWFHVFGGDHRTTDAEQTEGLASRREVRNAAGAKTLVAQAGTLRPSVERPVAPDVGWRIGSSRGVACWMGVRDSMVLLGPPGAGKGLNIVIPSILDAPGPVITTSTRPDNLTVTMTVRGERGVVGVFDPQGLAPGLPSAMRWSPVRGCERPQTAMIRAVALTADAGESVTEGSFWKQQTVTAVQCLLHAAAIGGKGPESLYEWSLSAPTAREAVDVLVRCPSAAPHWDRALDAILATDPKQRDSVWAMVANTFAALGDPMVLDAVSPDADDVFDPARFLRENGTLYLLGTSSGASATAGLVAALIEDVVEVARRLAAASQGSRLDPPLSLVLDEAANYPLPSLPALMSEGGGTGIPTLTVLQSLAQARDRWGREQAEAIWDASTVKLVLGGSSNADDLADISRMIGDRNYRDRSRSWHADGGASWTESDRREPILDPASIRTLRAGRGLLLLRSAKPIMLELHPWIDRADARRLGADRSQLEHMVRQAASTELIARAPR